MSSWVDSPVVSFSRDGQEFVLGRSGEDSVLHLYGSTGLGVAPVSVESSPRLTGDGSVVRGVRYDSREVYLPLFLESETVGGLSEVRRRLNRLLAPHLGPVDVRVVDPATDTDRMIRGYYTEGLDGDFGDGFHGTWQTLGLTFECPDPWWLGPERVKSLQVNPGSKPFLSESEPFFPVVLAESVVQGDWSVAVEGDGPVFPVWEVTGPGTDLRIIRGDDRIEIDGEVRAGETLRIDTGAGRITPDRWDDVSLRSRLFPLTPGTNHLNVSMVGATEDTIVRLVYRERYLEGV